MPDLEKAAKRDPLPGDFGYLEWLTAKWDELADREAAIERRAREQGESAVAHEFTKIEDQRNG